MIDAFKSTLPPSSRDLIAGSILHKEHRMFVAFVPNHQHYSCLKMDPAVKHRDDSKRGTNAWIN